MMPEETVPERETRGAEESAVAGYDVTRYLLQVKKVPRELKKTFWVWLQPLPAISNLRIEDVNRVLTGYLLDAKLVIQRLREKGGKITYTTLQWINESYFCLFMMLMRSVGEERERKLIATAFRVTRGMYEERLPERPGRFSRLFGGGK